jgi:hypothetical protein
MQAADLKTEANPAPTQAPSAEEGSSCAAQPGQRRYRPWLIGGALVGVPLLLWGGWDWLAAAGLATVLIAVAPCLAMCALGLCMRGGKSNSASSFADIRKTYEAGSGEPPSRG